MAGCQTNEKCHFCGGQAHAYWQGDKRLNVCQTCAGDIFPALAADAASLHGPGAGDRAKQHWQGATLAYWRAVSLRLLRERGEER